MSWEFFLLLLAAFISELIHSGFGMGFGTILVPILIISGYDVIMVVPSVLFAQTLASIVASIYHQRFKNMDMLRNKNDRNVAIMLISVGLIAVVASAMLALSIPKIYLKYYIGILVTIMGFIVLSRKKIKMSWHRIFSVGVISSINKTLTGGGFSPVLTGGQIASGRSARSAVAVTSLIGIPICFGGFISYYVMENFSIPVDFIIILTIGGILGAPFGPMITKRFKEKNEKLIMGSSLIILGISTLLKVIFWE